MRKKLGGVIFACDGVLLDSEAIYLQSLRDYLHTVGIEADMQDVVSVLGKPMAMITLELREKFGLSQYSDEEIVSGQRRIFRSRFAQAHLTPMPHLLTLLDWCKAQGVRMAIASSSDQNYLRNVTQRLHIEAYFDAVISGDAVAHGKPAPDIYHYAASRLNLPREELVIIEDSANGILAGVQSGCFTIGYKGSIIPQDTSLADWETDDFCEVLSFLKQHV